MYEKFNKLSSSFQEKQISRAFSYMHLVGLSSKLSHHLVPRLIHIWAQIQTIYSLAPTTLPYRKLLLLFNFAFFLQHLFLFSPSLLKCPSLFHYLHLGWLLKCHLFHNAFLHIQLLPYQPPKAETLFP